MPEILTAVVVLVLAGIGTTAAIVYQLRRTSMKQVLGLQAQLATLRSELKALRATAEEYEDTSPQMAAIVAIMRSKHLGGD